MSGIYEAIGNTKIIRLTRSESEFKTMEKIYAKAEYDNPSGSIKDRAAAAIIIEAEKSGALYKGCTIVEATSGNMGISLAMIGASRGYRVKIVMPKTASKERQDLIRAYGAEVILSHGDDGMRGALSFAEEIKKELPCSFMPRQFENSECMRCHYATTGPEIYRSLCGNVDCFVAGVGTGGTLMGIGKYLKEKNQSIRIVAVEPEESPLLSGGIARTHGIEGIGANLIPPLYDGAVVDEIITVSTEEAREYARILTTVEGIFAGFSTGAAFAAALRIAKRKENVGRTTVFTINDRGERYLSKMR